MALALSAGAMAVEARSTPHRDTVIREPFDARSIGSTADTCRNFFAYANGGHQTELMSGDLSPANLNAQLEIRTVNIVHAILLSAAHTGINSGSETRKLGTLYNTCMDDAAIERQDLAPIAAELSAIAAMRSKRELLPVIARLHDIGVDAAFSFEAVQNYHAPDKTIGEVSQAGLGLPAREYYLHTDSAARLTKVRYQAYLLALLKAGGDRATPADAAAIVALETRFARASMPTADLHQPRGLDHPMTYASLSALTPHLTLRRYFAAEHVSENGTLNVAQPAFLESVDRAVVDVPLRTWKAYLRSRLLDTYAPALPQRIAQLYFDFHLALHDDDGPLQFPRWERCVDAANQLLGDVVGDAYVKRVYPAARNSAAVAFAIRIKTAFRSELDNRSGLSARTKRNALAKLDAMRLNVGYPRQRRDYRSYAVESDSYAANVARGARFERSWELRAVGRPVDRALTPDAQTLPQTVNADSDIQRNEITVSAAMFAPPHFDPGGDDAANLGSMGNIISHEIMHGFDDEGSQFDAAGALSDWWSPQDLARKRRAERCVIDQYRRIRIGGGHYDGRLVAGEAIADLGGVLAGYAALHSSLARQIGKRIGKYTPEQRYFLAFAQSWGDDVDYVFNAPDTNVLLDEHPLARDRVNATLANVPAWYAAFGCAKPTRPICDVW